MVSLTAFDPETEISGQAMLALLECLVRDEIAGILRKHALEHIEQDRWYPMQTWLDVFSDIINSRGFEGTMQLVSIGMKYAEMASFPPGIDTLEDALIAVNDTYQLNHRNGYAGELAIVIMGPGHVQVIDHTPYPEDFTYGMLYALAHRFKPERVQPLIRHDDSSPCRKKGDDSCTFDITWELEAE
jgi:hypothetical protein